MNHWTIDEDHSVREVGFEDHFAWKLDHLDDGDWLNLCRVAFTLIDGDCYVSTMFIGIGVRFETMIFGPDHGGRSWRWATWDEALAGHQEVVAALMGRPVG
jgi:hypothetical protein